MKSNVTSQVEKFRTLLNSDALCESHVDIIEMHERLSGILDLFIQESVRDLKLALDEFKLIISVDKRRILEDINVEFEACISQVEITTNGLIYM